MTEKAEPQSAEKCAPDGYDDHHDPPPPLGGATSFGEADAYRLGQRVDSAVYDLWSIYDDIQRNIRNNPDLTPQAQATALKAAAAEFGDRLSTVPTEADAGKGLIGKVVDAGASLLGKAASALQPHAKAEAGIKEGPASSFTVTKDLAGNWRWLAIASNNFKDRDGEYFPESAHLDFVEHVDKSGEYPDLWLWHVKGSRIGMADFVAYADHFLLSSGTFDKEFEYLAPVMADRQYGVSHGFRYREADKQGDTYVRYRTFEISVLPPDKAANPWTAFDTVEALKEVVMLPDTKKQFLTDHIGPERTARVEEALSTVGKELEGLGISFKDLDDGAAAPPSPAMAAPAPAVAPEAAPAAAPAPPPAQDPVASAPAQAQAPAADPEPKPEGEGGEGGTGDNGGGDPEAVGNAELTAAIKALADLPGRLDAIETRLKAIESPDATPAMAAAVGAKRPSQSDSTVIEGSEKERALATILDEASDKAGSGPVNPVNKYIDQFFGQGAAETIASAT